MRRALDLFCGAGGAAKGLQRAGFHVTGVDIEHFWRYCGDVFVKADAMTVTLDGYDFVWASPPCQDHVKSPGAMRPHGTGWMLAAIRERLLTLDVPWVIENVPGAPMRADYKLCACRFNLRRLKRVRWFETSWGAQDNPPKCYHPERSISVTGGGTPTGTWLVYGCLRLKDFQDVMGIDWMTRKELSQAIPPAYSEFIGRQVIEML